MFMNMYNCIFLLNSLFTITFQLILLKLPVWLLRSKVHRKEFRRKGYTIV